MPFVYLLVFALISFQGQWPEAPWIDPYASLLAPWVLVMAFWVLAAWRTYQFCTAVVRRPADHAALWRRLQRAKRRQAVLLTTAYLVVLFGLGWGHAAREWADALGLRALTELIQFAPFVVGLMLVWSQFYRAERASHLLAPAAEPFAGRWEYLRFQVRHNLLLVVPPVVLTLLLKGVFVVLPGLEENDAALGVLGVVLLAGAIVSVPMILRLFLGLRPLGPGPLRDRLRAAARRLDFGFNDVLVWDTRRTVANAMVSGALPWLRYVVLTDLLIERLQPDEVEAVFGHEVGHIKHHHMLLYIAFFVGSLALLTGLWKFGEEALQPALAPTPATAAAPRLAGWVVPEVVAGPVLLTLVSLYVFVVFGYLSRRCERQADLYGCRAVSPAAFIGALEKVADLNGIPRHRPGWLTSWQHPSIAERVAFVARVRDDPALEPRFQRGLVRLKLGLMAALALSLAAVVALVAWQFGPEHVWDLLRVR